MPRPAAGPRRGVGGPGRSGVAGDEELSAPDRGGRALPVEVEVEPDGAAAALGGLAGTRRAGGWRCAVAFDADHVAAVRGDPVAVRRVVVLDHPSVGHGDGGGERGRVDPAPVRRRRCGRLQGGVGFAVAAPVGAPVAPVPPCPRGRGGGRRGRPTVSRWVAGKSRPEGPERPAYAASHRHRQGPLPFVLLPRRPNRAAHAGSCPPGGRSGPGRAPVTPRSAPRAWRRCSSCGWSRRGP